MRMSLRVSVLLAILFCAVGITPAQKPSFDLGPAKVGEKFDRNVADVLRDDYGQVLDSDSDAPDFRWSVAGGVLPEGLRFLSNGRLVGTPQRARIQPYVFRASVVDEASVDAKPLVVTLSVQVNAAAKKISADELPSGESKAQLAYTKKDPKVAYILVIESKTKLLKRVDDILTKNTVSDIVELGNGKSTVRVLAFDANDSKIGPDVTKVITTSNISAATEAVILSPPFKTDNIQEFPLAVSLVDQGNRMTKLTYRVTDPNGGTVSEGQQNIDKNKDPQKVLIRIATGKNNVKVVTFDADGVHVAEDKTLIDCTKDCGPPTTDASISVSDPFTVTDDSVAKITVEPKDDKKKITFYSYRVVNKDGEVADRGSVDAEKDVKEKRISQRIIVRLAEGANTVFVTGMAKVENKDIPVTNTKTTVITCVDCKGNSLAESGSSVYTRAILGFEQSGGSSSDSVQKPFLDFFFGAPIAGKESGAIPPRLSTWGQVRFASVPQQQLASGGLQNFTSGFLTNIQGLKVNELVQGFDFLAGLDVRLIKPKGAGFIDLDPGTRQNTSVSFVAGFGAINPFSQRQTAQIFAIPKDASGNIDAGFLKLFPEAAGKTNIAFVTPERDRFFRQYYGGFRFKTFFYDKHGQLINRFPALLDVTFGQNELVTGKLRNAIFRLEGFYPFPFKSAKFLYLYGTAMMKMGGGGVKTNLPVFLKAPATTVILPDDNTVIVPIDRNPTLRSTRDYYRFGMGINLIELLDKLRSTTPK